MPNFGIFFNDYKTTRRFHMNLEHHAATVMLSGDVLRFPRGNVAKVESYELETCLPTVVNSSSAVIVPILFFFCFRHRSQWRLPKP